MKVKYIGPTISMMLTHGKEYSVIAIERDWYRIVDESNEDYLYPPEHFEIIPDFNAFDHTNTTENNL